MRLGDRIGTARHTAISTAKSMPNTEVQEHLRYSIHARTRFFEENDPYAGFTYSALSTQHSVLSLQCPALNWHLSTLVPVDADTLSTRFPFEIGGR